MSREKMSRNQVTTYSIKLYHNETQKYEYLKEVLAPSRTEAIKKFRKETGWVDLDGTLLYAQPPICR